MCIYMYTHTHEFKLFKFNVASDSSVFDRNGDAEGKICVIQMFIMTKILSLSNIIIIITSSNQDRLSLCLNLIHKTS